MHAVLVDEDRTLVWGEVPEPVPKAGEILVDVHAAALNRADLLQRAGNYPPPPGWPEWMGLEVAGIVVQAPTDSRWRAGDKVCALLGGGEWWEIRFNQVDGPTPQFRQFLNLDQEFQAISDYCRELIQVQRVQPSDICLIYNGRNIKHGLETRVAPALADLGVELSVQANRPFARSRNILLATTPHSFKGYDSEVVIVPAADQYTAIDKGVLANNLYVAMTRARSIYERSPCHFPHRVPRHSLVPPKCRIATTVVQCVYRQASSAMHRPI